jgi:hypothetical protein
VRRSNQGAALGQATFDALLPNQGDPEVDELEMQPAALGLSDQHQVFRFDVAMHDAAFGKSHQRPQELSAQVERIVDREALDRIELLLQRQARDPLHGQERGTIFERAGVVHFEDVRVAHQRGNAHLARKALEQHRVGGVVAVQHLEGDFTPETHVFSCVHHREAAASEHVADPVLTGHEGTWHELRTRAARAARKFAGFGPSRRDEQRLLAGGGFHSSSSSSSSGAWTSHPKAVATSALSQPQLSPLALPASFMARRYSAQHCFFVHASTASIIPAAPAGTAPGVAASSMAPALASGVAVLEGSGMLAGSGTQKPR